VEWLIFLLAVIGAPTSVFLLWIDKVYDKKRRSLEFELQLQQERIQLRDRRILEIERDNEKLRKEIDWYRQLEGSQVTTPSALPSVNDAGMGIAPPRVGV
jgi:hypothetical protein